MNEENILFLCVHFIYWLKLGPEQMGYAIVDIRWVKLIFFIKVCWVERNCSGGKRQSVRKGWARGNWLVWCTVYLFLTLFL